MSETTEPLWKRVVRNLLGGLLVVLVLFLLAVMPLTCFHSLAKARTAAARHDLVQIGAALDLFRLDVGRYPTTQEGLAVLAPTPQLEAEAGYRKGGYLDRQPIDPWGNPYHYKQPGCHNRTGYDVWSYGADNAPGGEGEAADIGNWEPADRGHRRVHALAALPGALTGLVIGLPFYIGALLFRHGQGKPLRQALTGLHLAALIYMAGIGALIAVSFATLG